jgi:hypothetical protein
MHIYAFGSVCRGDLSQGSDIDLLALTSVSDPRFDPEVFSIYSYARVSELWQEGNPFAWHLALESRLLFSSDQIDHLKSLGNPAPYKNYVRDCEKFLALFSGAYTSIVANRTSPVFELSTMFLSIRNIATCFSLGVTNQPDFSRDSAHHLGANSIAISPEAYKTLERARILNTRGHGTNLTIREIDGAIHHLGEVGKWMRKLVEGAKEYERIQ